MLPRDPHGRVDLWPVVLVAAAMSAVFLAYSAIA